MSAGDAILDEALHILQKMPGLGKTRRPGETLKSTLDGPAVVDDDTLARLKRDAEPARADLQAIIFALDLLAAGAPDNDALFCDAEVQRIAGKLRERYSRRFRISAYADPVRPA